MDHITIKNFNLIRKSRVKGKNVKIIAVTKTFSIEAIKPMINYGHLHFGENKVQEAVSKWQDIRKDYENIKLHLIGKLQTNKVKYILPLFDYIHSLDNLKLAEKINLEQDKKILSQKYLYKLILEMKFKKMVLNMKN